MTKIIAVVVVTQPDTFHSSCVNITLRHSLDIVNSKIPENSISWYFSILDDGLYPWLLSVVYVLEMKNGRDTFSVSSLPVFSLSYKIILWKNVNQQLETGKCI